jgi:hypothetical protein
MVGKRKQESDKSLTIESEIKRLNLELNDDDQENRTEIDVNSVQPSTSKDVSDATTKPKRKYERKVTKIYKCSECDFETEMVSLL